MVSLSARFEATREFFATLPKDPGVYVMKNGEGEVIYVGKAKNIQARVKQYFRPGDDQRYFVASGLLRRVLASIEPMVASNEKEALLLENHLIKRHKPRFNIRLRDDKQYLVLRVDPKANFPRIEVVRHIRDDHAHYFGPYHSANSCRQTLRTINRHFQLRTCSDHVLQNRKRTCLQYQIKRCPGPCVLPVDKSEYAEQVEDVMMFLSGKNEPLTKRLKARMTDFVSREEFEAAAQVRDSLKAVQKSMAKQDVVQDNFVDQDVFGIWRQADLVFVAILFIRGGKWVGSRNFKQSQQEFQDAEVMRQFIQQYYLTGTLIPDAVILPGEMNEREDAEVWLSELRGKRVSIEVPKRGTKARLVGLANKNAAKAAVMKKNEEDKDHLLEQVQKRLRLRYLPRRIECFDIAHIQGTQTVASMVTFIDGEADKRLYRKFVVKKATNDDYASMYEVITRRLKRALSDEDASWALPDLLVVDGGKGQLKSAMAAVADLGIEPEALDLVALAKERDLADGRYPDRVYLRHSKDPVGLRPNTPELFVLARLRDEAHRFANTFHKKRRGKAALHSSLDQITGIGPSRRKALLKDLGSVKAIESATVERLTSVKGMTRSAALAVRTYYDVVLEKRRSK